MRRSAILGAAAVAALAAGSLAVTSGSGSSHREAPSSSSDPTADNTDLYAFTAPDAPGSLTIVSNWIPFEDPSGGPYFGKLDPKARYYVKIDNTGDGREDVAYRWQFKQQFRNPNSFLYAAPTVDSVDDPDINFVQTYDLYRETYRKGKLKRAQRIANDAAGRARQRRAEDDPGLRQGRRGRREGAPERRQVVRRPRRRRVLHRPRHGLRRHQHRQARPPGHRPRQPGRRQGRRGRLQHALVRAAGAGVRGDAQRQERLRPGRRATPSWASGPTTERKKVRVLRQQGQAPRARHVGPGEPPRQPADQRGHHPDRAEGQVQPHVARERRGELRRGRAGAGAGAAAERPVQPRREGDGPHGHRAGAADRRARADADRLDARAAPTR